MQDLERSCFGGVLMRVVTVVSMRKSALHSHRGLMVVLVVLCV
jgi:hypothetical protein